MISKPYEKTPVLSPIFSNLRLIGIGDASTGISQVNCEIDRPSRQEFRFFGSFLKPRLSHKLLMNPDVYPRVFAPIQVTRYGHEIPLSRREERKDALRGTQQDPPRAGQVDPLKD